jgi:hypothetical protein
MGLHWVPSTKCGEVPGGFSREFFVGKKINEVCHGIMQDAGLFE